MRNSFKFGEQIEGYDVRALNERAVRASAGILFFLAIIAFMNAWLMGNFQPTRVFVVSFLVEFTIRIASSVGDFLFRIFWRGVAFQCRAVQARVRLYS